MAGVGTFNPGVQRTDAPQEFDGPVSFTGAVSYSGTVTSSGTASAGLAKNPSAGDMGLVAWTFDPLMTAAAGTAITRGVPTLGAVWVRQTVQVSKAYLWLTVVANGPTSGQNFIGLYNSAGAQIALTADQTTNWGSLGLNTAAFTSAVTLNPGMYWIAILANATTAGPTVAASAAGPAATSGLAAANAPQSAAGARFATNGSTQTSLAASLTPASNVITSAVGFWGAIA